MNLQHQIDSLRRRYQSGDDSAREALQRLLQAYLYLIVRRAARPQNAASRVAGGIRRLTGTANPDRVVGRGKSLPSADEVCRQLCDELLQTPAAQEDVATVMDTFRKAGRKTECFAQVP
jgi:Arc/MetJ-type ribon-helix-helix transcriptional regulator